MSKLILASLEALKKAIYNNKLVILDAAPGKSDCVRFFDYNGPVSHRAAKCDRFFDYIGPVSLRTAKCDRFSDYNGPVSHRLV